MPALQELSIHFPLTREDNRRPSQHGLTRSFNPLPSHEGRRRRKGEKIMLEIFQSTSLSRGKTGASNASVTYDVFQSTSLSRGKTILGDKIPTQYDLSIHFPLTREDALPPSHPRYRNPFNPLPSHEGRLYTHFIYPPFLAFNPLPSHEGRPVWDTERL